LRTIGPGLTSGNARIRYPSITAGIAVSLWAVVAASAQTNKAPCGSFQKLPNGKWNVVYPVKIEHGNSSAMISPGTTIGPGKRVAGVDIYAALQQSCH